MFLLHPQLRQDTFFIADLPLCRVLLMNNSQFPWLILVPQVEKAGEIVDLEAGARHVLMDEIAVASRVVQSLFSPDKLNVAALGNIVPQLHVHVIARYTGDAAWPNPVWTRIREPYAKPEPLIQRLKAAFGIPA